MEIRMNAVYARRLWLLFRWDLLNGLGLILFMVAGFWGLGLAASYCRFKGWCA